MPIQTPFGLYSPEMLAQMAQGAFKPPQPMQMPGMQQQPQQQPGFNVGQGIAGLGAGLGGWKPADVSSVLPTEGVNLGGGAAGGMTTMGPGGQYSVTGLGGDTAPMPTSTTIGGLPQQPDFLTNIFNWIRGK